MKITEKQLRKMIREVKTRLVEDLSDDAEREAQDDLFNKLINVLAAGKDAGLSDSAIRETVDNAVKYIETGYHPENRNDVTADVEDEDDEDDDDWRRRWLAPSWSR